MAPYTCQPCIHHDREVFILPSGTMRPGACFDCSRPVETACPSCGHTIHSPGVVRIRGLPAFTCPDTFHDQEAP